MHKKKPDIDVIMDVLKAVHKAYPSSEFAASLLYQYQERGGLSKKQLQGLYTKAAKVETIASAKLATLEAIILKKSAKHRSPKPQLAPPPAKDESTGRQIDAILNKYPLHKRVLFYKTKYENNGPFSLLEKSEIEKFYKLLV